MRTVNAILGLSALNYATAQSGCDQCVSTVAELESTWLNTTDVEEILDNLEAECASKFFGHPEKKKVCDKFAAAVIQIPPGIFEGLETLAWDIPLGVCLTIAECSAACCEAGAGPEQIHLSLPGFGDVSRMGVSWVTLDGDSSWVQYQKADGSGGISTAQGTVTTYPDNAANTGPSSEDPDWSASRSAGSSVAGAKVNRSTLWPASQGSWVGTLHRAVMGDLAQRTAYRYRVGDGSDQDSGWSAWINFKTFPSEAAFTSGEADLRLSFAVIADMGYGNKSDTTVANLLALVEAGALDAVVHSGDVSYADGFMPHWDTFLNKIEPVASRIPYMVVPGNHEIWYNFSAFKHRFMMPGAGLLGLDSGAQEGGGSSLSFAAAAGSGDGMYYAWGVPGLVHFAALDSETDADTASFRHPQSDQVGWISGVLSNANSPGARESSPWSLAHFHRPLYCSNDKECSMPFGDHSGGASILRDQAEALFYDNQVDMIMAGHIHSYERSYPMVHGNATSGPSYAGPGLSPVYVVQGSSGNRETNPGFPADPPAWSGARSSVIGFGIMNLSRSALDFTFYESGAADAGGPAVVDHFTITK